MLLKKIVPSMISGDSQEMWL